MKFRAFVLWAAGLTLAASFVHAQAPRIDLIGREEFVSSLNMERPSVATDSKGQPHFSCDAGGPTSRSLLKFHRVNGKWSGGVFATGYPGGRYNAGRLYVSQMEIDGKDRAWISCKFGIKEFGNMFGQGLWLFNNVSTRPRPPEQFFRFVCVYKGMGVVTTDSKYVDEGVMMGTFGNWEKISASGKTLAKGSINAGHGGEKVRARIAAYAPRFRDKDDTKAYPDSIWHTAMNGSRSITASYQNSARYKAGQGPIPWAAYGVYPIMGGDFHHPGVGLDATDPRLCYISIVFYGKMSINIWDGTRMLFNPASLKVLDDQVTFEERHPPAIAPAPGPQGGAFFFWTSFDDRILCAYVSKKGVAGPIQDITAGTFAGAATDRYGNLHLVYNNNGIRYRKLLVYTLQGTTPEGRVESTRTPSFRWSDTRAARYTVALSKDGAKLATTTVSATTWTPGAPLAAGVYSWRVKEGWPTTTEPWSPALSFVIPPAAPAPLSPDSRSASAFTPTFEWTRIDRAANQFTLQLFKNGGADPIGAVTTTGDIKPLVGTADWTNMLGVGSYTWNIKATRVLKGYTISSDYSDGMTFQVRVPGPAALVRPLGNTIFNPGYSAITSVWTSAAGARDYKLRVLYNGEILETYYGIGGTNFPMTRTFQPGYHTLLLQPQNAAGNGDWSDPVTVLVRRHMNPVSYAVLDRAPARLTWTRTKEATRYLAKLSKRNPATRLYQVVGEKWIAQSPFGAEPLWKPTYSFTPGAYRWSVTDYFGTKQGYTSVAYFKIPL